MRTVMMLAAAAALLPLGARADAAGNRSTTASLGVQKAPQGRTFQFAGDTDWFRVQLAKGADYYVTAECECAFDIRDGTGKVLGRGSADAENLAFHGFEFRAPYRGLFFVEAVDDSADYGVHPAYPLAYQVTIEGDCASRLPTRCALALGRETDGTLADADDVDDFRARLSAGTSYTATVQGPQDASRDLFVTDPGGAIVASSGGGPVTFTAAASGYYTLSVATEDFHEGGPYSLALAPASGALAGHGRRHG